MKELIGAHSSDGGVVAASELVGDSGIEHTHVYQANKVESNGGEASDGGVEVAGVLVSLLVGDYSGIYIYIDAHIYIMSTCLHINTAILKIG